MAAKGLITSGVRRRIGNGNNTLIWEHPWLHDELEPMIQTEMPPQLAGARVGGLIDQSTSTWDPDILSDIFQPDDIPRISKIPVSLEYEDIWYWYGDPNGCYTVKNGYRRIVGTYEDNYGFDKWNTLWKLKISPKWKTFLWRAISDILPTTTSLIIKRVDVNPICAMCGLMDENIMHSLVLCDYARTIWDQSNLPLPHFVRNIFQEWFRTILNVLDTNGVLFAAAILYNIWRARNEAVWNSCLPMPKKILAMAITTMQAWQQVHHATTPAPADPHQPHSVQALPAHTPGTVATRPKHCFIDAGYRQQPGSATRSIVIGASPTTRARVKREVQTNDEKADNAERSTTGVTVR
ncbi:PREDICTED: uncharacterized protein LOC109175036 [Ipomoea nil]|uniref:uncharacterized protein LOC109175036 n=1 Tax=Ipomoea nil TaxID=35883 RepID=UPI00090177A8|nr:PREDICTED: uncharacterized protein LOC109175036 [Ipomoea nil]